MRLRRYKLILVGLTVAIHGALALLVAQRLGALAGLGAVMAGTALLGGRLRLALDDRPIGGARRFFERLYYAYWAGLVGATILLLPAAALALSGRLSFWQGALIATAVGAAIGVYGVFFRARHAIVRRVEVSVDELPRELEGFRVAQLSDVHVGSLFGEADLARLVARVSALEVDLVALTGDYVTTGNRFHAQAARGLSRARAREGVIAVMGNHDYAGGGEPLLSTFAAEGVRVLRNEALVIARGEAALIVAGLDDIYTRRADVGATFAAVRALDRPGAPVLVLAHDPRLFERIAEHDPALVLSGHTHWGQIGVPFFSTRWNAGRRLFRYAAGRYARGRTTLWVHPGVGGTGAPFRLGVAPEITVLELRSRRDAAAQASAPSERKRA